MTPAYLSLGSNLGDRLAYLVQGVRHLLAGGNLELTALSGVYETAPWGKTDQGAFLNAVLALRTDLSPWDLLARCRAAEAAAGRQRQERWGPRTLDVDILVYGSLHTAAPDLVIPHPRLGERAFVLVPLLEVAPDLRLPGGPALAELFSRLPDQGVAPYLAAAAFLARVRGVQ